MANIVNVTTTNTFEEWRVKTNELGTALGDLDAINSNAQAGEDNLVATLNNLRTEATNNAGWIGDISILFDGYGNLVEAVNHSDSRLDTKDTEQGDITDLTHYFLSFMFRLIYAMNIVIIIAREVTFSFLIDK